MNVRPLIAIAAVAFAGSAFAQSSQELGTADAFTGAKTRAEVQAELAQYKKDTPVNTWSYRYNPLTSFKSTLSRDEVRAAYIADRDEVAARNSEDSGSSFYAQSTRSVQVRPTLASAGAGAQLR